jgi:hypothetical protein
MKSLLCGLLLFAVAGMAAAQVPMSQGTPGSLPAPGMPSNHGQPQFQSPAALGQPQVQAPVVHSYGNAAVAGANCCPTTPCCEPCRKTCERVPAIRLITHVTYCKTCEEFCVPKCSCCLSRLCGGCGGCLGCDGPYAKYYLVKKVHVEQCPTTKCVPGGCDGCVMMQPK